ncbi:hypothetical protein JSY36_17080 [Bacillus sp. H-16]|uniref:hypothetical protein n=1 Tax=Alteribacter salitolerans TaxID=2912333 RepID=UPI001962D0B3|nr:hypothetical protein [Alteribacter salitolerans]MBM7097450.1 hypothetical protein [Alteribacter salitolerans]
MVLTTLVFCLLIGFDGLLWGAIIGYKRIYFPVGQLLFLSAGVGFVFFFTYMFGSIIGFEGSTRFLNQASGLVFLAIGFFQLTHSGGFMFGRLVRNLFIIVNIDNIGYGVISGVQEVHPLTSVFVACSFFALFVTGIIIGNSARFPYLTKNKKVLPSLVLITIGIYKLFFG